MRTTLKLFCGIALLVLPVACEGRLTGDDTARAPESPLEAASSDSGAARGCQAGTYKIAYQGPLSGEFASLGKDIWRAFVSRLIGRMKRVLRALVLASMCSPLTPRGQATKRRHLRVKLRGTLKLLRSSDQPCGTRRRCQDRRSRRPSCLS